MTHATVDSSVNETKFSVRFNETDMAGVFHHSNMFVWFEVGRFNLVDRLTNGHKIISVNGEPIFAPVTKTRVAFTGFGRFGDELRLETFLKPQETTKLVFYYRVTQVNGGATVALGMTEHVTLTTANRFLFKWPADVQAQLKEFFSQHPYVLTDGSAFDAKL